MRGSKIYQNCLYYRHSALPGDEGIGSRCINRHSFSMYCSFTSTVFAICNSFGSVGRCRKIVCSSLRWQISSANLVSMLFMMSFLNLFATSTCFALSRSGSWSILTIPFRTLANTFCEDSKTSCMSVSWRTAVTAFCRLQCTDNIVITGLKAPTKSR